MPQSVGRHPYVDGPVAPSDRFGLSLRLAGIDNAGDRLATPEMLADHRSGGAGKMFVTGPLRWIRGG